MDTSMPRLGPNALRVGLADRHPTMRNALQAMLDAEQGIDNVASTGSWSELVAALRPGSVDVLLLDYALVAGRLRASIGELLERDPALPLIVMTIDRDELLRPVAVDAGARYVLLKDSPPDVLVAAITTTGGGGRDRPPDVRATTEAGPVLSPHVRSPARA